MSDENGGFAVLNAETGRELCLAMEGLWLRGRILPVGARLLVVHTFRSEETKPLEAVYAFALPRDAALRRFRIVGEKFQARSELKPVQEAQQQYEEGITEGHLAALARTYRDGRVNLSVGNIRPGELVKVYLELVGGVDWHDDGLRFRFPFTLAPCYHRHARAVESEPGVGEMELPEEEFGDLLLPPYLTDAASLHRVGFDLSVHLGGAIATVASPSHALRVTGLGANNARVTLSRERDVPDRDLVLDAQTREPGVRCAGGACRDGKTRFTAVLPSTLFGRPASVPRSVLFILDRSGSMHGQPLEQAKKAVEACLSTLSDQDRVGLVAFDDRVETFRPKLVQATRETRDDLRRYLARIDARGGTELAAALDAGARLAGAAPADLLVVTDGQVAATEEILQRSRKAGQRMHCLGIGAASQDRFLSLLARATGGISRFATPRERVDAAALELFVSIGQPVATSVKVTLRDLPGDRTVLEPAAQVYAGHPLVVMGETDSAAHGTIDITWERDGVHQQLQPALDLEENRDGETVRLLQGARLITDLESNLPGELQVGPASKLAQRQDRRITEKLEKVSREYGLASRVMALVAVVERPGDDPSQLPTTRVVPVGMPQDTGFPAYFRPRKMHALNLSPPGGTHMAAYMPNVHDTRVCDMVLGAPPSAVAKPWIHYAEKSSGGTADAPRVGEAEDRLMEWAARLEPDGGLPGKDDEERRLRSLALLVALLAAGSTLKAGPFRVHIDRLLAFLKRDLPGVAVDEHRQLIQELVAKVEAGGPFQPQAPDRALLILDTCALPPAEAWTALAREFARLL